MECFMVSEAPWTWRHGLQSHDVNLETSHGFWSCCSIIKQVVGSVIWYGVVHDACRSGFIPLDFLPRMQKKIIESHGSIWKALNFTESYFFLPVKSKFWFRWLLHVRFGLQLKSCQLDKRSLSMAEVAFVDIVLWCMFFFFQTYWSPNVYFFQQHEFEEKPFNFGARQCLFFFLTIISKRHFFFPQKVNFPKLQVHSHQDRKRMWRFELCFYPPHTLLGHATHHTFKIYEELLQKGWTSLPEEIKRTELFQVLFELMLECKHMNMWRSQNVQMRKELPNAGRNFCTS